MIDNIITNDHVIDYDYILGKIAITPNPDIKGRVIAISKTEFGKIIFSVEPINGSPIENFYMEECAFDHEYNLKDED